MNYLSQTEIVVYSIMNLLIIITLIVLIGCMHMHVLEINRTVTLLHLLQHTAREHRVAFVGISNWALDPAKMNRGVMIIRGSPDEEELEQSAR